MNHCPVCYSEKYELYLDDEHPIVSCLNCSHRWQEDLKVSVNYDSDYISSYFEHNTLRQMSLLRAGLADSYIRTNYNATKSKILDFGYGSGDFLRVMSKLDYSCYGLDVHGLSLGVKEIEYDKLQFYYFELVTFFDSLEHLENFHPLDVIKARRIIVSVPIYEGKPENMKNWKHYKPGEHLHYFTDKSIRVLFNKKGYSFIQRRFSEDLIRGKIGSGRNITTYFFHTDNGDLEFK